MLYYVMNDFDPDDLDAKLRAWKVEPHLPASFQREVWQRIGARQAARGENVWFWLPHWIFAQLARPQNAAALVVFSLALSIGLADLQARGANAKQWKQLEARYADSVNPLALTR